MLAILFDLSIWQLSGAQFEVPIDKFLKHVRVWSSCVSFVGIHKTFFMDINAVDDIY